MLKEYVILNLRNASEIFFKGFFLTLDADDDDDYDELEEVEAVNKDDKVSDDNLGKNKKFRFSRKWYVLIIDGDDRFKIHICLRIG